MSERRIQQLSREGVIPKAERGQYDLVGAVRGYVGYLRDLAVKAQAGAPDFGAERARLIKAKADLAELGIARVADALSPATVAALQDRLVEQAAAEAAAGVAFFDGGDGANQRVWNLPSKGAGFRDLLRHPVVRTLADRGILAGVSLGRLYPDEAGLANGLIVAVTETTTAEDVETFAAALQEVLAA